MTTNRALYVASAVLCGLGALRPEESNVLTSALGVFATVFAFLAAWEGTP